MIPPAGFDGATEIWKFLSKYDINGLIGTSGIEELSENNLELNIYPNPANSYINIRTKKQTQSKYLLLNILGERVLSGSTDQSNYRMDMSGLPAGVCYIRIDKKMKMFIKE